MSRISMGTVNRAEKNVRADGKTIRQWNQLGRWKEDGMLGHIFTACPVIFLEWAGRDYRWTHDNRSAGICPVCEAAANRGYYNQLGFERRLVGEYRLRKQAAAQAQVDAEMEEHMTPAEYGESVGVPGPHKEEWDEDEPMTPEEYADHVGVQA